MCEKTDHRRAYIEDDSLFERTRKPIQVGEGARLLFESALQEHARSRPCHQAHAPSTCRQVPQERHRAQRDRAVQEIQRWRWTQSSSKTIKLEN